MSRFWNHFALEAVKLQNQRDFLCKKIYLKEIWHLNHFALEAVKVQNRRDFQAKKIYLKENSTNAKRVSVILAQWRDSHETCLRPLARSPQNLFATRKHMRNETV